MPGRMEFEFRFGGSRSDVPARGGTDAAMRILIMGDFAGHGDGTPRDPVPDLLNGSSRRANLDNLEKVLHGFSPGLRLQLGGPSVPITPITLAHLDDFHPDRLFEKLEIFKSLRHARERLLDPATFADEAAEFTGKRKEPRQPSGENSAAMFERLLGKPSGHPSPTSRSPTGENIDISRFLHEIVRPYITPAPGPEQQHLVASVDEATAAVMREILHHRSFQALESSWRSVWWLLTNVEESEGLSFHLMDVTQAELELDIAAAGVDLERSALYGALIDKVKGMPGAAPWSAIVGNFYFGREAGDLRLLAALGAIASRAGCAFLAGADPRLLGCRSLVESPDPSDWTNIDSDLSSSWQALRQSASAAHIGLALPRLLRRLPYGKKTDPVERFAFEEVTPAHRHEEFLWGNPAFACALLLARAFAQNGPAMEPGDCLDIEDLPAHVTTRDGAPHMTPCSEVCLTQRASDAILGHGIMPLMSFRNRNAVRLARFQSVADPPAALSRPWHSASS